MSGDWIGTRHLVIVPIIPTGIADPMNGIIGNETARIVGSVFVARGEHRPMSLANVRARERYGADASAGNGEYVYAGDPIAMEVYPR